MLNGSYAIINKINLSATLNFTANGFRNEFHIVFHHIGLYRQTVFRRRVDNTHFTHPDKRHVQGSRNRRSTQGKDVDIVGPALPFFFLRHTKTLFFVHHEDVRRAATGARPRQLSQEMTTALSRRLGVMAPLLARGVEGVGVEIVTAKVRKRVGGDGPVVEIHGHPGEVLLYLYGRKSVAQVEFVGEPGAVARLASADLGV